MIISLINRSKTLPDAQVQDVIRAINRQLKEDFEPYWSFGATLRLEGPTGKRLSIQSNADMRGDAVLYLVDGTNALEATGWHLANLRDIPYGIVFLGLCEKMNEPWSITLSHEALELVGDPMCNLLVEGNHPFDRRRRVFHLFEMCDAVQAETYTIDGVAVSNFVLPSYFSLGEQEGRRNDFLGTVHNGKTLLSFGMNPGAYLNIYDPKTGKWSQPEPQDDSVARARKRQKALVKAGRGYRRIHPGS
ncbi:MAG: hypothetical protein NTU86_14410 [Burkholderiales bacterium]|nr:hypothetical protein [Burkholderiales bacterium]